MNIVRGGIILLASLVLFAGPVAYAEEESFPDKFMLRLGGYHAQNANSIMRLDSNDLPVGAYVDFNETLGVERSANVIRADSLYRFSDHHAVGLAWYSLKFTGSRTLGQNLDWGNISFPSGMSLDTKIDFDIVKLNYQYSLFHNKEAELGVLAGFHVMRTSVDLLGAGVSLAKSTAITAPLPVLGLFADYHFTPRLSGYYNIQLFSINYNDTVKGSLQDFLFGAEYRIIKNVAAGVAYNRFNANLTLKGDASTLNFDTGWNGLMLYGSVYF